MQNNISFENVKSFIYDWNIRFPIDRWWREKYKVPFMSKVHRESSFIDQLIEYKEDELFYKMREKKKNKETSIEEEPYIPGKGNFMKQNIKSQEISDVDFNSIDLSKF